MTAAAIAGAVTGGVLGMVIGVLARVVWRQQKLIRELRATWIPGPQLADRIIAGARKMNR